MKKYTTILGDTWDGISYKLFKSSWYADQLQRWNRDYIDVSVFGPGVVINYEDIEPTSYESKAPWR